MNKSICFAYYANGKFIGWYADSFGSIRDTPKVYSNLETMRPIITKNLSTKIQDANNPPVEIDGVLGLFNVINADSANLLKGKEIELKVVKCPYYDGPNPDFNEEEYDEKMEERKKLLIEQMNEIGIDYNSGPSAKRTAFVSAFNEKNPYAKCNNWIYADYAKVKEWAKDEPTEFIETIKPNYETT